MSLQRWCTSPPGAAGVIVECRIGWGRSLHGRISCSGDPRWAVEEGKRNQLGLERKGGVCARLNGGFRLRASQIESESAEQGTEEVYGSELEGFARQVAACNAGRDKKVEFLPFLVGGNTLGFVHYRFAEHLKRFPDVFSFRGGADGLSRADSVSLHQSLSSPQKRTVAVKGVLEALRGDGLIPGWRDELLPVKLSYGAPPSLLMERAAVPLFGVKVYGGHVNGCVNIDGELFMWVAKRSDSKPTFPGMLDVIAAGAQPECISAKDNVIKECEEEASIPAHLADKAVAVGVVSYEIVIGETYKRDVLFCYDLELPKDFVPLNRDGEVQGFYKLPISEVVDIISKTDRYKPNSALVIIDFLVRHGYITPEQKGYLSLLRTLRTGEL